MDNANKKKMEENEIVFRHRNEQVQRGFDELQRIAKEDQQQSMISTKHTALHFFCECSDENCKKRVRIEPQAYAKIHRKQDCFVVLLGHSVPAIERIVEETSAYCVVEKFHTPDPDVRILQSTPIDNG